MKNYFHNFFRKWLALIMLVMSLNLSAQHVSAVYSGGVIFREDYAIDELKNSGFNTVIVWTIHIAANGDLNFNGEFPLVENGVYIGDETYPNFPAEMQDLKTAPTSVNRVEFGLSAWGSGTFAAVRDFYESEGFGPGTTLYENFAALRDAIPAIDAFNNDDESEYHVESAVAFTRMLADLGFQNAIVPYTNTSFWSSLVSQVNSTHPGNIDRTYLQVYAGGSGNNPCASSWDFGIPVIPGLWGEGSSDGTYSPQEVENQMSSWYNQCGIGGGFMWFYSDFDNSPQVAAFASAINDAFPDDGGDNGGGNGGDLPTFYIDCDYGGGSFSLDVGSYDRQALNSVNGFVNNAVSSIEVPDGYSVTIYNRNLSQSLGTFTSNDDCLSDNGADNAMTSVVVSATNARTSTVEVNGNLESSESIMVYPNPFVDVFQVQLPSDTDYIRAKVIDLSGKELINTAVSSKVLEFDLSKVQSASMLFLKIEGEMSNEIIKLIRK